MGTRIPVTLIANSRSTRFMIPILGKFTAFRKGKGLWQLHRICQPTQMRESYLHGAAIDMDSKMCRVTYRPREESLQRIDEITMDAQSYVRLTTEPSFAIT